MLGGEVQYYCHECNTAFSASQVVEPPAGTADVEPQACARCGRNDLVEVIRSVAQLEEVRAFGGRESRGVGSSAGSVSSGNGSSFAQPAGWDQFISSVSSAVQVALGDQDLQLSAQQNQQATPTLIPLLQLHHSIVIPPRDTLRAGFFLPPRHEERLQYRFNWGDFVPDDAIGEVQHFLFLENYGGQRRNGEQHPTPQQVIDGLQRFSGRITPEDRARFPTIVDTERCICMEEILSNENEVPRRPGGEPEAPILMLPCGHCFHEMCLQPWLSQASTCPLCRRSLV